MGKIITFVLFLLVLASGCHQKQEPNYVRIYGKAELDALIKPDMTVAEITNTFGSSGLEMEGMEQDSTTITYLFSPEAIRNEKGLHLAGFDVNIRNGRAVGWSAIDTESFNQFPSPTSKEETTIGEENFKLFIQTDFLTNALSNLDSGVVVNESDLKISPDMVFKAQVSVSDDSDTNKTVLLIIDNQQVPQLKTLTENNFGKRMLVVCRGKVIAAPSIVMPLDSNKLLLKVKDANFFDSLKK
jgi:hypothetical protein